MSETNVAVPVGAIEGDLACRKCSYNLRGLDVGGRCPECGTPVGYSVQGDLLRFSDPDWLRGLRRGIHLILGSVLIAIVMAVLAVAILGSASADLALLLQLLMIASQAVMFFGVWKLTESDPSGLGEEDYGSVRRFIRITLLIGIGRTLLRLVTDRLVLPDVAAKGLVAFGVIAGLIGIAGFCCQSIYLGRLARRLPDDVLARARTIAWMIGITYTVSFLLSVLVLVIGRPSTAALIPFSIASGITGIVLLVAFVRYLLLIERIAKRLKVEEAHARTLWAAPTAEEDAHV